MFIAWTTYSQTFIDPHTKEKSGLSGLAHSTSILVWTPGIRFNHLRSAHSSRSTLSLTPFHLLPNISKLPSIPFLHVLLLQVPVGAIVWSLRNTPSLSLSYSRSPSLPLISSFSISSCSIPPRCCFSSFCFTCNIIVVITVTTIVIVVTIIILIIIFLTPSSPSSSSSSSSSSPPPPPPPHNYI